MANSSRSPFALRFATPALPAQDLSDYQRSTSVKGLSKLSEAELQEVAGGGTVSMEMMAVSSGKTPGTPTFYAGRSDVDGGDYGAGFDF